MRYNLAQISYNLNQPFCLSKLTPHNLQTQLHLNNFLKDLCEITFLVTFQRYASIY